MWYNLFLYKIQISIWYFDTIAVNTANIISITLPKTTLPSYLPEQLAEYKIPHVHYLNIFYANFSQIPAI
jgi:hypothetical protein